MSATTAQSAIAVVGIDIGKNGAIVLRQLQARFCKHAATPDRDGGVR
jgi:hypothetical protein